MKPLGLSLLLVLVLVGLVAAWSKEGPLLTTQSPLDFSCPGEDVYSLQTCLDYEIFRLRDELASLEGANVTFYGMRTTCMPHMRFVLCRPLTDFPLYQTSSEFAQVPAWNKSPRLTAQSPAPSTRTRSNAPSLQTTPRTRARPKPPSLASMYRPVRRSERSMLHSRPPRIGRVV